MKHSPLSFTFLVLVAVASVTAAGGGTGPAADPTQAFEVSGPVLTFNAASGSGMPMISVDDATLGATDVALGPVWFLQEAEFSAAVGDDVHLLVYPCATCAASAVAAWVENLTTGASVDLRNEDGRPLWIQRQSRRSGSSRPGEGNGGGNGGDNGNGGENGNGEGDGDGEGNGGPGGSGDGDGDGNGPGNGSGLDMSAVETVTGTVIEFTGHAGSGQPLLSLDVDGTTVEIVVSPYAPVNAAGLVIDPGMVLTVTYAPTDCDEGGQLIAISITDDTTGIQIQLRDPETGFPMSGGSQQNRPNWP